MKTNVLGLVVLSLSLLTACGWQLRGALNLPDDLHSIYIQGASADLSDALRRQLEASGIAVLQTRAASQYTLAIARERHERRTAALGSDALAAQYELISSAEFEFRRPSGALLTQPDQVHVTRSVNYDAGQVLGSASESALVQREMTRELASQVIRRLSFITRGQPATPAASIQAADGSPAP